MSDRRRKYTENSVVASIGQIQAMLADERRPARRSRPPARPTSTAPADAPAPPEEQAAPVAMPVGGPALVVPSWEEVQSNREARWSNESQDAVLVPAMSRWLIWRRRLILGVGALVLIGATVAVMWLLRPVVPEVRPMAMPYTKAINSALLTAQAQVAQQEIGRLQAEVDSLTADKKSLETKLAKATDDAAQAAVIANTVASAKPKVSKKRSKRRSKARSSTKRRVRRGRKATSKTDKSLEGLLNGL